MAINLINWAAFDLIQWCLRTNVLFFWPKFSNVNDIYLWVDSMIKLFTSDFSVSLCV